ncbi:MAG: L-threonylcarbamoyladenylate synthase, partial [Candidatus Dormibacteria bacterium]
AGGVVGFPTDTVYGLACAATDPSAIERLYRIKGRPDRLPLILMGVEAGALAPFVRWTATASELGRRHWPGALTLVLRARSRAGALRGGGTVGVRIPDNQTALALLRASGPLATTSANRHGQPPALAAAAALAALPGLAGALDDPLADQIAGTPSSILDLTRDRPVLLREGRLSARELGVSTAAGDPGIRRD